MQEFKNNVGRDRGFKSKDREGNFKTIFFEPYSGSTGIDEPVIALYSKGILTMNTAEIWETRFHNKYSKSTILKITDMTMEEVKKFQNRPLDSRYIAIFLNGLFFF